MPLVCKHSGTLGLGLLMATLAARICEAQQCEWFSLVGPSGGGVNGTANALAVFDDGRGAQLYVGGLFDEAGGVDATGVARWDGLRSSVPASLRWTGEVQGFYALSTYDEGHGNGINLYAGGWFRNGAGSQVNAARWDGSWWSGLIGPSGTGVEGGVYALAGFDDGDGPALYAGGGFAYQGNVFLNFVARWTGSAWQPLSDVGGYGVAGEVYALFADGSGQDGQLLVGGGFPTAAGIPVNNIARWSGGGWHPLAGPSGVGVSGTVHAITVFDDGTGPAVYVGGRFETAGGVLVHNIAKWDGEDWSPLVGSLGSGTDWTVLCLTVHDDGTGPALFAGGAFTSAGSVLVNGVAKWDGEDWTALSGANGVGVNGTVFALTGFNDGSGSALFASGDFTAAGGTLVNHIAKWQCTPPPEPCLPDLTGDGELNFFDVAGFLQLFSLGLPEADWNADGALDFFDALQFLQDFAEGCP